MPVRIIDERKVVNDVSSILWNEIETSSGLRTHFGLHALTVIDTYAATPHERRSDELERYVAVFEAALQNLRGRKASIFDHSSLLPLVASPSLADNREQRLVRCAMVSIFQRLNFYIGRSRQLTMAEMDLEMSRLRGEFRIPSSFDVEEEASAILSEIVADSDAISRAIVQQSEWVRLDEHTSLSEFTTLLEEEQRKDSECLICREDKDLAAITIACKHIFCEECLGA